MMAKNSRVMTMLLVIMLVATGCKKEQKDISESTSNPEEVKAREDMLSRGMQKIPVAKLAQKHVGKRCVITAQTASKRTPPPPPRGMVHVFGDITVYLAELVSVSAEILEIRAPYTSGGTYKTIEIPRDLISAVAVAR